VPRGPRTQRLNIFLFKDGIARARAIRNDVANLDTVSVAAQCGFEGEITTKGTPPNPPRWKQFVQSGADEDLGLLMNQSASCLVVLTARNRTFALAFGAARHWIDDSAIVRRFGMIVTLNTVHPDKIRSVDREEFETIQRKTRSQTSVSSSLDNFGLDVRRDLVRSVTGQPENQAFGKHVTGADNLILSAPITFTELAAKCGETLDQYARTNYRDRYSWIDNFVRVADPLLTADLDAALVNALRTGNIENAFLTPPDTLDTQEHRGFRYPGERRGSDMHDDLRMEDFLSRVDQDDISIENLRAWRIREYTTDEDTPSREFRLYNAVIFEVGRGEKLYALSLGEWFEIAQNHVAEVNQELDRIEYHDGLALDDARPGETEGEYNRRIATSSEGALALLDTRTVSYGGGRSSIEICDLLSTGRAFVHVKAKTKSSTLSHLFAQGLNSAQAFRDRGFRRLAREQCPASHSFIFDDETRIADHTVTFAIITQAPGDLKVALPFFSKQSLVNATRELSNMGYQVRLKKIRVAAAA
jgi:uncharacterized protein (TIGR04141 family)